MLPGYYSMRRPFLPDSELCHPMKQYSSDSYSSALGSKAFSYEHSSSYPSFIDSYYQPDSFGDYRSATAYTAGGGSLFSPSALSTLLPSLSGETSSHLLLVLSCQLNIQSHYKHKGLLKRSIMGCVNHYINIHLDSKYIKSLLPSNSVF